MYSKTPIEQWLEEFYKEHHILSPNDLDIYKIAESLNIVIEKSSGPDRSIWDDEHKIAIIFLHNDHSHIQKREIFFHELCHPLRHCGSQENMYSEEFLMMQEVQAEQFQLYASMPFFMVSEYCHQIDHLAAILANEFHVSIELAETRLKQIEARIQGAESVQRFNDVIQEQPVPNSYKTVAKKVVPHHAKSLVEKALFQKQKKEMTRQ
ncbi:ImmA/IrrE family metallo-endopeptidase [Shouchella lehensis]|uniref:ImmA/IrrE family metallo-endopeptidase n=1 Tax=Shouchella lehensis TaxID=300825 RepID=UPI00141A387C|nr:ImmA/IrrE family metallo-endopeptidase [Shouchella lehensis]